MATGPNFQGCFVCEGSGECDSCNDTTYGCCPDNLRAASGPNFQGCEEGMYLKFYYILFYFVYLIHNPFNIRLWRGN